MLKSSEWGRRIVMQKRNTKKWVPYFGIVICCWVAICSSCRNTGSRSFKPESLKNGQLSDSVITYITGFHKTDVWKKYFESDLERLNLESLEKGYASLQIRFWMPYSYDLKDTSQLIIIKQREGKYTGVVIRYLETPEGACTAKITSRSPKSGWEKFYEELNKKDILNLPDHSELKNYYLSTHPFGIMVEVATRKSYRIFEYPDYEVHYKNFPEAKKIYEAMQFLENEFGFKMILPH